MKAKRCALWTCGNCGKGFKASLMDAKDFAEQCCRCTTPGCPNPSTLLGAAAPCRMCRDKASLMDAEADLQKATERVQLLRSRLTPERALEVKHRGLHTWRLSQNSDEAQLAEIWLDIQRHGNTLNYILDPSNRGNECTDRDATVAASVIQWLGTNVGRDFLARCGYVKKTISVLPPAKQKKKRA